MRRVPTVQECMERNERKGESIVINDGIVVKFEREGRKCMERRAIRCLSRCLRGQR